MLKKKWKKRLALALGVFIFSSSINVPDSLRAQGAVSGSAAMASEAQDVSGHPTGGAQEMLVGETADRHAAEKVPSYENIRMTNSDGDTVFDRGTGDYGYGSLSENQQKFYRQMQASLEAFRVSGTGFEAVEVQGGQTWYSPFKVNYSNYNLKDMEAVHAFVAFLADCPWIYWINGVMLDKNEVSSMLLFKVRDDLVNIDLNELNEIDRQMEIGVQAYLDRVADEKDVYEKVRMISDQIINSVDYAYKADGKTPENAFWAHTIVGVLDGEHHSVVCEGYAKIFAFIMNILDIPNVYIMGKGQGAEHAWNCVSFDGGDTYYYMDLTWDDMGGENQFMENCWMFFAMPKNIFEKTHRASSVNSQTADWLYALPALGNDMDYTYFEHYGAHATSTEVNSQETAEDFLRRARAMAPGEKCVMLLDDKTIRSLIGTALDWTELPGIYAKDYGNDTVVCADGAEDFCVSAPAMALTLSDTKLEIDYRVTKETTISLSAVTAGSDDFVRYYSDNNEVVMAGTPYTKAAQGEQMKLAVRKMGKAVIYAVSAAGKATASCTVIVGDGSTPAPTSIPTKAPGQTSTPTGAPGQTSTPTGVPGQTSAPTEAPGQNSSPSSVPTKSPGQTVSPMPSPGIAPTQKPDTDVQPTEVPKEDHISDKNTDGTKESQYQDKKSNALYIITGTGKKRTAKYLKSLKKKVKTATIPATVSIGGKTYQVTAIAKKAFAGNGQLRKAKIGKNIQIIGSKAFYGCSNLKSVKFGKNVTSIQAGAFQKCTSLTMITIPRKVKKIGSNAFRQCKSLRYILVNSDKLETKNVGGKIFAGGYRYPRVKTHKKMWKKYAGIFLSRDMSGKALFVINPVKLII